jgi:hypothetical protein
LRESTPAGVADFERDLDQAALRFSNEFLGAGDALAGDELQRGEAGRAQMGSELALVASCQ